METCKEVRTYLEQLGPSPIHLDLRNAPDAPVHFVGRQDLLGGSGKKGKIQEAWESGQIGLFWLIGYAGEGKTSLARRWVDNLITRPGDLRPVGIFWWDFETQGGEEGIFFERLLAFLESWESEGDSPPAAEVATRVLTHLESRRGRYVFILDSVQHAWKPSDSHQEEVLLVRFLRRLTKFGGLDGLPAQPFCVLTTRFGPKWDEVPPSGSHEESLRCLPLDDGCELLQKLGVQDDHAKIEQCVERWQGHAWTLELLGSLVALGRLPSLEHFDPGELAPHDRERFLDFYTWHLKPAERVVFGYLAEIRRPLPGADLTRLLEEQVSDHRSVTQYGAARDGGAPTPAVQVVIAEKQVSGLVQDLVKLGVLRPATLSDEWRAASPASGGPAPAQGHTSPRLTIHSLLRSFASKQNRPRSGEAFMRSWHLRLHALLHQTRRGGTGIPAPRRPAIPHRGPAPCDAAGDYAGAWNIAWDKLSQGHRFVITTHLCAYDVTLQAVLDFYEGRDLRHGRIRVPIRLAQRFILRATGLSLRSLGLLHDAIWSYRRALREMLDDGEILEASVIAQALAELRSYRGQFRAGERRAAFGLHLARQVEKSQRERPAGSDPEAKANLAKAIVLERMALGPSRLAEAPPGEDPRGRRGPSGKRGPSTGSGCWSSIITSPCRCFGVPNTSAAPGTRPSGARRSPWSWRSARPHPSPTTSAAPTASWATSSPTPGTMSWPALNTSGPWTWPGGSDVATSSSRRCWPSESGGPPGERPRRAVPCSERQNPQSARGPIASPRSPCTSA